MVGHRYGKLVKPLPGLVSHEAAYNIAIAAYFLSSLYRFRLISFEQLQILEAYLWQQPPLFKDA